MASTNLNTYLNHGISSPLVKLYAEQGANVLTLPICPKCERIGLRDKGWSLYKTMCCPHCGYKGRATHQLSAYINEDLYK